MKRVDDVFPALLRKQRQKQLPAEDLIRGAWPHIAGRQIALRSQVFRVFEDTLIVHVPDQGWRRQLVRFERQIADRVNQFLGRNLIRGVDFHVDATMPAVLIPAKPPGRAAGSRPSAQMEMFAAGTGEMPPKKGPVRELAPAVEAELAQAASAIADPELRDLFMSASRKMVK